MPRATYLPRMRDRACAVIWLDGSEPWRALQGVCPHAGSTVVFEGRGGIARARSSCKDTQGPGQPIPGLSSMSARFSVPAQGRVAMSGTMPPSYSSLTALVNLLLTNGPTASGGGTGDLSGPVPVEWGTGITLLENLM